MAATATAATLTCSHLFPFKPQPNTAHIHIRRTSKNPIQTLNPLSFCSTAMPEILTTTTTDGTDTPTDDGQGNAFLGIDPTPPVSHSNPIGAVLNLLSKWMVALLFGIIIVWKHDAEILWIAMGSVINTWFSVTLKKLLNHQRPVPRIKSDPGMPSSHAQSLFYASIFLILSLVRWLGVNTITVSIGTLTMFCSAYLSWLRVSQQFHTMNQIIVGSILGSSCAALWFWAWHAFVYKAFISSIWVCIAVISSSVISCLIFVIHVIRHWLKEDE